MESSTQIMIAQAIIMTVQKNIDIILENTGKFFADKKEKNNIDYGTAFTVYLENAVTKYSTIRTLLCRDQYQYIEEFYQSMNVRALSRNIYLQTTSVFEFFEKVHEFTKKDNSDSVLITGSGGMGKSTLLKYLFLNSIKETSYIPLFFELREYNDSDEPFENDLYHDLNNLGCKITQQNFYYALGCGCFLILLDGLDEVKKGKRERLLKELDVFLDKYPNNKYILSSRPNESNICLQRFIEFEIAPLTKKGAISLIKKVTFDEDSKKRFIKSLDKDLYFSHREFASNPLLLNIMLLTFDYYAEIPDKLFVFYQRAFETLLISHDATKGHQRSYICGLVQNEFEELNYVVSFLLYAKRLFKFDIYQFKDAIKNAAELLKISVDAKLVIDDMQNSICIVIKDGLDYKYVHRNFQEYFSAVYIMNLTDDLQEMILEELISHDMEILINDNICTLLFSMCREKFEKNFIIPQLEKIIKSLESANSVEIEYLRKSLISIDKISISENSVFMQTTARTNWRCIIDFICGLYSYQFEELSSIAHPNQHYINLHDYIKKHGKLNFSSIQDNDKIIEDVLAIKYYEIHRYHYAMEILDNLKQNKRKISDDILKIMKSKSI